MSLDSRIEEVLEQALETDIIVGAFAGFVKLTPEHHEKRLRACICQFRDLYNGLPAGDSQACINAIVTLLHKQQQTRRTIFVCDMIKICLKDAILPARSVLDCLIHHEQLKHTRNLHWCKTFHILRQYIHLIDYKGCRDILHLMLLKLKNIPISTWASSKEQVDSVVDVIEYLLDPEACLLPGYLAVNELRQYVAEDQPHGHWSLSGKIAEFIDRFRATATMVTTTGRSSLLPVVYHFSPPLTSTWKLEHDTLRFKLKGQLPYDKDLFQRQTKLLRYILEQPYSRDMVCHVLNLQKQQKLRCDALEMELVDLVVTTMERTKDDAVDEDDDAKRTSHLQWQHLSSQVIYFVLFQFAVFPCMVETLYRKLAARNIKSGRDHLMWVLLQFISGSIQKNPLSDFLPVIKLVNLLYPEKMPLPVPDITKPSSTHKFAAICILMHLNRKAQNDSQQSDGTNAGSGNPTGASTAADAASFQHCPIPPSLQAHHEYLQQCLQARNMNLQDYNIALICNACSTTNELFNGPINHLVDSIYGDFSNTTPLPGDNCFAFAKTVPLSMSLLDSLTVHTKMSMIHHIVFKVLNLAQDGSNMALSPAVVETYSRLLVYMETESLGIKGLISQVFPKVLLNNSLGILNTLLEMFSYRLHHIQPQYRIQLLINLHMLAAAPNTDHNQLQICVESTALRMITALSNSDVKPQLSRFTNEPKQIISKESEELNRALVLTLARSIHITGAETISGSWCNDILKAIMTETPHRWASYTLKCFPRSLQLFYQKNQVQCPNKETLKNNVEEEYQKWGKIIGRAETNENTNCNSSESETEAIKYFTAKGSPSLFLCLLWKVLTSGNSLSPVCHKILSLIGRRRLSSHVRTFADFLVHEFSLDAGSHVTSYISVLRDFIWMYNLVFLDQLILCLTLRCNEDDEAQVAFFIIQYLLIKPSDFLSRVHSFVQDINSAEHWLLSDWHSKHMNFHRKFPEKFYFEGLEASSGGTSDIREQEKSHKYLPVYFGNITLRFLPVFDLVVHRFLELMPVTNMLETLLVHFGPLYKFHEQPITYLFNTLHYYEAQLRDHHNLKNKLVTTIIGSMKDTKPTHWALSAEYLKCADQPNDVPWVPSNSYFCAIVQRLVDTIGGKQPSPFPSRDWRFNEFPNAAAHALHVTCVELLALPMQPDDVGLAIMNVVLKMQALVDRKDLIMYINSVALILTTLPEVYWKPLHYQIIKIIKSPEFTEPDNDLTEYPYHMLKFSNQHLAYNDLVCTRLLALTHVVWHHMGIGQLSLVPQFLKEDVKPHVSTEIQLLYVFHLIGPFLPRFQHERTRCMIDVAMVLYDMLLQVSNRSSKIQFMDQIADFLYHIKYMHIGVAINERVENVIEKLQPRMRERLRFITQSTVSKQQA